MGGPIRPKYTLNRRIVHDLFFVQVLVWLYKDQFSRKMNVGVVAD